MGLFRGRFSPAPAGTSRRPLTRDTGRRPSPAPRSRANLSVPGAVPGNSSISLSPRRLQETETHAPPLRRGLAEPGAGAGAWACGAPPKWGAGRPGSGGEGSFSGDPTPGGLVRPAALHHPLLPRESRTPNPSRAGCGGWQSPPARERNAAAPAARGWAPFLCAYCGFPTRWRREGQGHLQRAVQPECGELPLAWEGEGGNGHREV